MAVDLPSSTTPTACPWNCTSKHRPMKKWKDHWKELLPYEKRFEAAMWVLFCAFAVFISLDFLDSFGVLAVGFDAFEIAGALIAAAQACQAVVYWRTNRKLARTSLLVAIIFCLATLQDIVMLLV